MGNLPTISAEDSNYYINHRFLSDQDLIYFLSELLTELISQLNKGEYDRAYDLVDCIHSLPGIIADNNFTIPKNYWSTYLALYREKWDKTFVSDFEMRYRQQKE